ncbi:malto-oligosyltrehalose trehalohydrolase [Spirulina subsalsa]|uniref:malto-oligosyltrehalose trehalohydrolase n=1 Tax=Spirulina subsalsa TaxID=54311 RepID=UPI0002FBA9E0|nr:malto-oligosyltrehalose trehalohydrolase [Spirulina subsalsa]
MKLGSHYLGHQSCQFRVWSPTRKQVSVHLLSPEDRLVPLTLGENGYWEATVEGVSPGTYYQYQLDGDLERPDPASHSQPQGVHGPSEVIDQSAFLWQDTAWRGLPLSQYVIYELHVGTFTPEGTFEAIIDRLPDLVDLGINAIEIMPVAQFPGSRNWGYDGTFIYGVQNSYGGVNGLKKLVNACHQAEVAVILDVVYNHFGPEGNYLWAYAPYFTDRYKTPWGDAVNFDQGDSNEVREFFIQNALYWLETYHIDALRLDAVHAIYDLSAQPFLQQLGAAVEGFNESAAYPRYLIAESDLNDVRVLQSRETGGFGHASQWCDDFHHGLHTILTGERSGYYCDFGSIEQLAKSFKQGYIYTGEYSPHRRRNHGNVPKNTTGENFVVCIQNHDQIGNRLLGDRLSTLVDFERLKLAAATVLLSPFVPMLFMGEEYGEKAPFQYFVSHSDPGLIEGVRQGRAEEFKSFGWENEVPDPQGEAVFEESKLNWGQGFTGEGQVLRSLYKTLIALRKQKPALSSLDLSPVQVLTVSPKNVLSVQRQSDQGCILVIFNYEESNLDFNPKCSHLAWHKILESTAIQWQGSGYSYPETLPETLSLAPLSFVVYEQQ